MGCRSPRRGPAPRLAQAIAVAAVAAVVVLSGRPARADRNDLRLVNLCDTSQGRGCPWLTQTATRTTVTLDSGANTRLRSLMSELGAVIAPRLQTPADTLGFAGFQLSAELDVTSISNDKSFWNGIEGVQPANPNLSRPSPWLTTVGGFVRKGMFSPVPSIELGAGAVNVLQSGMWALEGYVKVAVQEGFHGSPLPSLALRAGLSDLVGTDQLTLRVISLDVVISKAFSIAGTARFEPFLGGDLLLVSGRSGVIDATPECDAAVVQKTDPKNPAAVAALPRSCQLQAGTAADLGANFTFPSQSIITRARWFGGGKLRLWKLFLVGQFAFIPAGGSRDGSAAMGAASDQSGGQKSLSLSVGLDL